VSGIIWLASYPKSGNTWLRSFLANFYAGGKEPVDINSLDNTAISGDRRTADDALGVKSSDLTPEEVDRYRPAVYRAIAARSAKLVFMKVHDAYRLNSGAEPLIPTETSAAAIYLVRNPLDVAISFSRHLNVTVDEAIERMSCDDFALASHRDRLDFQLPQELRSWSQHVSSWLDQRAVPIHLMRYEDMHGQPVEEFVKTIRFIGVDPDIDRVHRAVTCCAFDVLRQQERDHGFREWPNQTGSFFHTGRVGGWRGVLTAEQVDRLLQDHGTVMRRLGYLDERGSAI
jgi:hypothetical protein